MVDLLDREALLERTPRGPISSVDWPALLRRWTQDYSFVESNRTIAVLEPRGLPVLLAKLRRLKTSTYAITGSLAAAQIRAVAPPRLAAIFVPSIGEATERLGLRRVDSGANVLLAEPYGEVVFERTWKVDAVTFAALSQVAADLLTGPGRSPAEADELIRWMGEDEDAWRSQL